ncbi:hypothetical protein HBI25_129350 [Parastagonospora nodorum]|nr:hypothetical protein HBH52_197380 [Parastagonospora nodorum]KAH3977893.1 hypothetical protein HBH51_070210 [Parastagonospora nodorum]KAH4233242.1 hypothetical protein HBI06_065950 [Parastagonospora nodorum]KAH4246453.1 hypothetical protein HBI05_049170 [Parastagonospora nodorum]KAH4416231.1 hypothetical protein HBH92_070670 [Parastagonospora nodorum]
MAPTTVPDMLTPPASSTTTSQHASTLPQPRRQPLRPGGPKESELIRYLDHGVNSIQKRVDNRVTNRKSKSAIDGEDGYSAFHEVAKDLDALVDVVWVSGSPNLQTPYLLNIAVLTIEFLPLFPNSARSTSATFRLLSKLDEAFTALLTGHDSATGEVLPGFNNGRIISTTDKVRLKGVVERTRLTVARELSRQSVAGEESDAGESMDTDTEVETTRPEGMVRFEGFGDYDEDDDDDDDDDWEERNIGTVYEKTIGELGDVLGGPPIGIITDDWSPSGMGQQRSSEGFMGSEDVIEF